MNFNLAPMQIADLDEVVAIENEVHSHPWSRGNFVDSLAYVDYFGKRGNARQGNWNIFTETRG